MLWNDKYNMCKFRLRINKKGIRNKMENFIKTLDNTVFCFSLFFHSKRNRIELEKV